MAKYTSEGSDLLEDHIAIADCCTDDPRRKLLAGDQAARLASLLNRAERMEAALRRMRNECRRYLEEHTVSEADENDPNYISPLKQADAALEEQPT